MEIKTCEQYVLDKLERAENDVESLKVDNQLKDAEIHQLRYDVEEFKKFVQTRMSVGTLEDGAKYISFDSPWEKYDEQDYTFITQILAEKKEEMEDE